jgi:exonuclease SbcD
LDVIGSLAYDTDKDYYDPDHNIVEIEDKGFVVAIPFIYERHYAVFTRMLEEVTRRNTQNLPVVVMGHLVVLGCNLIGHDPSLIGGMETHPIDIFGDSYDYLALGHIHGPQTLPSATGIARYSGSVLHVSFDENYPHTVSVVQVEKHGDMPMVREERIDQRMHTYTIPKDALPFDEALEELRQFKPDGPGYVRLNIKVKDYAPANAERRIREILADKPELKFCYIKTEFEKSTSTKERLKLDVVQLKEINPLEVAKSAYEAKYGVEMDAEKVEMMQQVINEVNQQQ